MSTSAGQPADESIVTSAYARCSEIVKSVLCDPDCHSDLASKIHHSNAVIDECLKLWSPEQLSLSYNGGKDCLVLLVLIMARIYELKNGKPLQPLQTVHIRAADAFEEVDKFVAESQQEFCLNLQTYSSPMKSALEKYLENQSQVKAIFVGVRRQDPFCSMATAMQLTDDGWPKVMRVQPILDFDFGNIWQFILLAKLKYCPLYDMGYTSLGGINSTVRNTLLRDDDGEYLPAHMLKDYDSERLGRK